MYIRLNPIYPNKIHFFTDESNFNWFTIGKPCVSLKGEDIIIIGSHALFFDNETGKTYRKTSSKEYILSLSNNIHLKKGSTCTHIKDDKFICPYIELIVNKDFMEENGKCPYIEYSKSRLIFLQSQIPDFPSNESLKKFKPGTDSLYLKMLLSNYFYPT